MNLPAGLGLVQLMDAQSHPAADAPAIFDVTLSGSADPITPQLVNGTVPIATVPVNLAAVLHAKTGGTIQLAAVTTLGVLYVVAKGPAVAAIHSVADLAGQTVWSTGQGTTPQYVMDYLLAQAGVADAVTIDYLSEADEVASKLVAADSGIAVLPEPYLTLARSKDPSITPVIDVAQAWAAAAGSSQVTVGLVVNRDWADAHVDQFAAFQSAYQASIQFAVDQPDQAGVLVAQAGLMPDANLAATAIPRCHLVYLAGDEAKTAAQNYLQVLYDANPASVGGALPGDDFYRAG
jgi:NitT/TauT family transport system substrate-binding protein